MNELIRRDKAIEIAEFYATHGWPEDQIGHIAEEIKKLDTVDERGIGHAHWKKWTHPPIYACSKCEKPAPYYDYGDQDLTDYCPECGRRMDEVTR